MLYALVGVVLFLVRRFNNKALLIVALFLLFQPIEWGRYIYYLFNNDYTVPVSEMGQYWKLLKEAQLGDSFLAQIKANTVYGHKVSLMWAYDVGRLVQTGG